MRAALSFSVLHRRLLGEITDLFGAQVLAERNRAGGRLLKAQKALHQSALSCAVLAQDAEIVAVLYFEIKALQDGHAVIGKCKILTAYQTH